MLIDVYCVLNFPWRNAVIIVFREEQRIFSFAQLYWYTLQMLAPYRWYKKTAVVLGPISDESPALVEENLNILRERAVYLSDRGYNVLDITSYHQTIERVSSETRAHGCPHGVLDDFTLPLIREGLFNTIHFREPFDKSADVLREYEVASQCSKFRKIRIVGFKIERNTPRRDAG